MAAEVSHERRAAPRVSPAGEGWDRARLRPGRTAEVVDLSAGGALIETDCRLLPGVRVELQLGDPKRPLAVVGRVLRCEVALVRRDRIRYRGALAFDHCIPWVACGTSGK